MTILVAAAALGVPVAAAARAETRHAVNVPAGPLDRAIGNDAIAASLQCVLALHICWTLDTTVVNVMIVIALLGFISTVSVTRFRKRDNQ